MPKRVRRVAVVGRGGVGHVNLLVTATSGVITVPLPRLPTASNSSGKKTKQAPTVPGTVLSDLVVHLSKHPEVTTTVDLNLDYKTFKEPCAPTRILELLEVDVDFRHGRFVYKGNPEER